MTDVGPFQPFALAVAEATWRWSCLKLLCYSCGWLLQRLVSSTAPNRCGMSYHTRVQKDRSSRSVATRRHGHESSHSRNVAVPTSMRKRYAGRIRVSEGRFLRTTYRCSGCERRTYRTFIYQQTPPGIGSLSILASRAWAPDFVFDGATPPGPALHLPPNSSC